MLSSFTIHVKPCAITLITSLTMFQVIHPPYKKVTLACIACLCFEIGVCPWPDLSSLFQYTSPTPVVSLHLIPRIQYHPGIPDTLLTGSSSSKFLDRMVLPLQQCLGLSSAHFSHKVLPVQPYVFLSFECPFILSILLTKELVYSENCLQQGAFAEIFFRITF